MPIYHNDTSGIKARLDQLETSLQRFIEGSAARLFQGNIALSQLSRRLVDALLSNGELSPTGDYLAPSTFLLFATPDLAAALRTNIFFLEEMTGLLDQFAAQSNIHFDGPVIIRVLDEPALEEGDIQVVVQCHTQDLSQTDAVEVGLEAKEKKNPPEEAFLIVNGTRIYSLNQPVVNIGRHSDNHLVLNDQRVSRLHAQLRYIHGRYVIFDLNSAGGTWVNGRRVRQQALKPGDVISLAGVPIVFGQEDAEISETQGITLRSSDAA